jgi:hypothetical protein
MVALQDNPRGRDPEDPCQSGMEEGHEDERASTHNHCGPGVQCSHRMAMEWW